MKIALALVFISLSCIGTPSGGYERRTHQTLTNEAVLASILNDERTLSKLGIRRTVESQRQKYLDSKKIRRTILDLIVLGSDYEDDFPPGPIYHFFDPTTGLPLRLNAVDYPGGEDAVRAVNLVTGASPDWAISGVSASTYLPDNNYSFSKARTYFHASATADTSEVRDGNRAKLFEALGRIIHHIEDMAQPQHVRNDNHLSDNNVDAFCEESNWTQLVEVAAFCQKYKRLRRFSLYEAWTDRSDIGDLPTASYAPVYPDRTATTDGVASFPDARAFWTNAGKGMADYTNRNFLSENTLERAPPTLQSSYDIDVRTLCTGAVPPCADFPGPWPADEYVTFFTSAVDDRLRPETGLVEHRFAGSASIFDAEFVTAGEKRVPGLNRFTFAFDHKLLLPRAVGYSAGLINYFFRGDIEVAPPDENVYAVADTSAASCQPVCGFTKLKMKLRNATYKEVMGPGTLVAVARYWRNRCYLPDLSGDFGGPAFDGNVCRDKNESTVVSKPVAIQGLDSKNLVPMEFIFDSLTPIPFSASDLDLQVVFRGQLGAEQDAVAVSTVDVNEPQYVAVGNITDWAFDDRATPAVWRPVSNATTPYNTSYPVNAVALSLADPATVGHPLATIATLAIGQHAQIGFLPPAPVDQEKYHLWLTTGPIPGGDPYVPEANTPIPVDEFKLREGSPDTFGAVCPVMLARGVYRQAFRYFMQIVHHIFANKEGAGARTLKSETPASKLSPSDCSHMPPPGTGGFWDFSVMTPPFGPTNEARWTINF